LAEQGHDEKVDDKGSADKEPNPVPPFMTLFELVCLLIDKGSLTVT
jgi:hypothetical protein